MSPGRAAAAVGMLAGVAVLAAGVGGCRLVSAPQRPGIPVRPPARPPAVLVLILAAGSPRARADFRDVVVATARAGERLIVLSAAGGVTLGSFTAPRVPAVTGPARPARPASDATGFQLATYRRALKRADAVLRRDRELVRARQQRDLHNWAERTVREVQAAAARLAGGHRPGSLAADVADAAADIGSLQQAGTGFGERKVIAIIGQADGTAAPHLHVSLNGITVAVADGPGAGDDAAWQADLLQAGASRAVVLTPATGNLLAGAVRAGLDGQAPISFPLTRLSYAAAQYALPAAAVPSLRHLLRLLAVSYPGASATIDGYTDNIAVPGGNLTLSWKRAVAVLNWLVRHGIAADRLQAIGHGSADPLAPNRPGGQPLNRRVVVIITPDSETAAS